jgi:polyferredoxin
VIGVVPIYILVNLACGLYYWRERRDEFNVVKHAIVPILGTAAFVPGFAAGSGLKLPGLDFIAPLGWPLTLGSLMVAIWMAIGVVYLAVLYATNRQKIRDTAKVFIEEEADVVLVGGEDVERVHS